MNNKSAYQAGGAIVARLFIIFTITAVCCSPAQAQTGSALADWLKEVQSKLKTIVPNKSLPRSAGNAGVRGDREDTFVMLYWKGKKTGEEQVTEEEMTTFKAALEPAVRGEREAAIKMLEKFLEQHPDSALVPDAKKTLDLVKAEAAEQKKAAAKEKKE